MQTDTKPRGPMLRVELERRRRGLSQLEVASYLGVWPQQVSWIERGRWRPSEAVLDKLASLFGLPAGELLQPVS